MTKSVEHKIDKRSILPAPTECPFCDSSIKYTSHAEIYGGRVFSDWPFIYLCMNPQCGASVGVHQGTTHPLGTLADKPTKDARKLAHAQLDPIWREKLMKRGEVYQWLANQLGIERFRCHVSWFDRELALKVAALCADKYLELRNKTESGSR